MKKILIVNFAFPMICLAKMIVIKKKEIVIDNIEINLIKRVKFMNFH